MKRYLFILVITASALMLGGCNKNNEIDVTPVDLLMTFATDPDPNTTYRVMCFDENNTNYIGTGTYRYAPDVTSTSNRPERSLMPCQVYDDGVYTGIDSSLYALINGYSLSLYRYITIVSPARKFNEGSNIKFILDRSEVFYATSPKSFLLKNYSILDFNENMKDLRSRLDFSFYRGDNLSGATIDVGTLSLTDAGTTAEWIPNTGAITTSGDTPAVVLRAPTTAEHAAEPNLVKVNKNAEYVFASTYGSNGVKTIKIEFDLTINGATTHERYILSQTLEKMKYYKFEFNVTSETITLVLKVHDLGGNNHTWESNSIPAGYLGSPESTVTLGTWIIGSSWENGGGGSGTIG